MIGAVNDSFFDSDTPFSLFFQNCALGMVIISLEGRILAVNRAFLTSVPYEREAFLGYAAADLNLWVNANEIADLMQKLNRNGTIKDFEIKIRSKTDRIIPAVATAQIINFNRQPSILLFLTDICHCGRLRDSLQEAEVFTAALNRFYEIIGSSLDLNQVLAQAMDEVATHLACSLSYIALWEDDHWKIKYTSQVESHRKDIVLKPEEAPICTRVRDSGVILNVPDTGALPQPIREHVHRFAVRAIVAAPLIDRNQFVGVISLNFAEPRNAFSQSILDLIQKMAQSITLAIQNSRLRDKLTEELRAGETVRQSLEVEHARLHTILENLPIGVFVTNLAGKQVLFNNALKKIWRGHIPLEDFEQYQLYKAWLSDSGEPVHKENWPIFQVIKGGTQENEEELDFQRFDGTTGSMVVTAIPVKDHADQMIGGVAIVQDVTEKKAAEKKIINLNRELIKQLDDFKALMNVLPLGAVIAEDPDCITIYANEFMEKLLRVPHGTNLSFSSHERHNLNFKVSKNGQEMSPGDMPVQQAFATGKPVYHATFDILFDDGKMLNFYGHAIPLFDHDGNLKRVIGIFEDITQQQNQALQKITSILESITDAFFSLDETFHFTYFNHEAKRLSFQSGNLIGKNLWEVFPEEKYPEYHRKFHQARTEQKAIHFETYNLLGQYLEFHIYPAPDGLSVYFRDITERIESEEKLTSEKELLRVTLNSLGEGVIATDSQEQIILFNHAASKLLGYSKDEAIGQPLSKIFYVFDDKTSETIDINTLHQFRSNPMILTRDLQEVPISLISSPIQGADGKFIGTVAVFQDISEKLKTQQELSKADKLESLGILAGGIAHDFNNILGAILSNVQLAIMKMEQNQDIRKYLTRTVETTRKASELTNQLLTFSKGGSPVKKDASLVELLKDTTEFALRGAKIKAEFQIQDNLWLSSIDEGQISQVIHNLVINAQQAMPRGGVIQIAAENIALAGDAHYQPGNYVKISVQDQGIGIPKENLGKIFDPFFTTKKSGNGLGLATSYSIIRRHNGYIEVVSQEGIGTTFIIYLPAVMNPASAQNAGKEIAASLTGLKILFMDDEDEILKAMAEMLAGYGHQVVPATNGLETIELYKQAKLSGAPFDVVIMDLTIPGGMGGQECIADLRDFDPKVKAILSSGYANDPVMSDYERYGFVGMVNKPYKIDELNQVLNAVFQPKQISLTLYEK